MAKAKLKLAPEPLKLDFGCGKNKRQGFHGVDRLPMEGVDTVLDLAKPWPWEDGSVDEANASHVIEHLTWPERVHFFNELHRVMKAGAQCAIVIPHWASMRYYGDPTHKEPFSEFAFYYLDEPWREANAPHAGYTCDFLAQWGYNLHPEIALRAPAYQQHAMTFFKEACQDIVATLTKREKQ